MGLKTLVKVGEVTNLSDARYCAGMGVSLIGFRLDKNSSAYVSPEVQKAITGWLEGVEFVGEFEDSSIEEIKETIKNHTLHYIQVNSESLLTQLLNAKLNIPLILKVDAENSDLVRLIETYSSQLRYTLIESESDILPNFSFHDYSIILGTGIKAETLEQLLEDKKPRGIALKGSPEIRPGFKNFDELSDILEALEID